MLVDDSAENIKYLNTILKGMGKIRFATDPTKVIAMLQDVPTDLIVLDVDMPQLDGYELCRQIKQDENLKGITVIFVTAKCSEKEETRGLMLGAVDYISKPFFPAIIKARIQNHLNIHQLKSQLTQANEELERISNSDFLTGTYNRRFFMGQLEKEIYRYTRYQRPLCLILIVLDNFKSVNDLYGHDVGDEVLKKASEAMDNTVRQVDFVCRTGGEEFCILLPETEINDAHNIAQRIRINIANIELQLSQFKITASIGLASYAAALDKDNFIKTADQAMYQSKQNGKNQVTVASDTTTISHKSNSEVSKDNMEARTTLPTSSENTKI